MNAYIYNAYEFSGNMVTFSDLGLKKDIAQVLKTLHYNTVFECQQQVIPLTIQKKNVVFTSRTGSGKTFGYTLGFLSRINKKLGVQMLVVVPTRELAIQVGKEIKQIAEPLDLNVGVLYGGRDMHNDYRTLRKKNHIMVGTPGRLISQINVKGIKVGDVSYLVFDESDQMFDQGFYDDCVYIKSRVGKLCQLILASATITENVEQFIDTMIVEYELIQIGDTIPQNIIQEKVVVEISEKEELVKTILKRKKYKKVLIFTNRKDRTYQIAETLKKQGINARTLNSDLEQDARVNNLNLFKQGRVHVLVATDIAARGLHIEQVDLVINYDVPTKSEFYVHRIGRTGRIDKPGHAITFICSEDKERFKEIVSRYKLKVTILGNHLS